VILALSTTNKVGLLVVAGVWIAFALLSSLVIPRYRPGYPGRSLPLFLFVTIALFVAMFTAVLIFGAESEEEGHGEAAAAITSTN
jgi:hypothetical protein